MRTIVVGLLLGLGMAGLMPTPTLAAKDVPVWIGGEERMSSGRPLLLTANGYTSNPSWTSTRPECVFSDDHGQATTLLCPAYIGVGKNVVVTLAVDTQNGTGQVTKSIPIDPPTRGVKVRWTSDDRALISGDSIAMSAQLTDGAHLPLAALLSFQQSIDDGQTWTVLTEPVWAAGGTIDVTATPMVDTLYRLEVEHFGPVKQVLRTIVRDGSVVQARSPEITHSKRTGLHTFRTQFLTLRGPLTNERVLLERRAIGTSRWDEFAQLITDEQGRASHTTLLTAPGFFRFTFPGNEDLRSAASDETDTQLHGRATITIAARGSKAAFSGRTTRDFDGASIPDAIMALFYRPDTKPSTCSELVKRVKTDKNGNYRAVVPKVAGLYQWILINDLRYVTSSREVSIPRAGALPAYDPECGR